MNRGGAEGGGDHRLIHLPDRLWVSFRLDFPAPGAAEDALVRAVAPTRSAAETNGLFRRWVFSRRAAPGSGHRLRVRFQAGPAALPVLRHHLQSLLPPGANTVSTSSTNRSSPEARIIGAHSAQGLDLIEVLAQAASDLALHLIALDLDRQARLMVAREASEVPARQLLRPGRRQPTLNGSVREAVTAFQVVVATAVPLLEAIDGTPAAQTQERLFALFSNQINVPRS
jgi:hypothetical protein